MSARTNRLRGIGASSIPLPIDGFVISLALAVILAVAWPQPGATGGPLRIDWIATYGVSGVFFLYGLTLAPEKMTSSMRRWKLHLVVQAGTFIMFPAIVFTLAPVLRPFLPAAVITGLFYIAALPSTVSSSVAMTSLARGNVPVAIFNATLSSFIGVFATPMLMSFVASTTGHAIPLLPTIAKVSLLILLPIVLGQIARIWLKEWAHRNRQWIKVTDRAIILCIVYNTFSDSMLSGIWSAHSPLVIVEILGCVIALFCIAYTMLRAVCLLCGFDREATIACLFCGSKKSLATGVPIASVIFGATPQLGLILAPIMLYHFCQLVIVSFIAGQYARDAGAQEAED